MEIRSGEGCRTRRVQPRPQPSRRSYRTMPRAGTRAVTQDSSRHVGRRDDSPEGAESNAPRSAARCERMNQVS